LDNLGLAGHSAAGVGNMAYVPGAQMQQTRFAVRIRCDDGAEGAYVTYWVGTPSALGQAQMLAPYLLGRDPEAREQIYDDLKPLPILPSSAKRKVLQGLRFMAGTLAMCSARRAMCWGCVPEWAMTSR
jgi:hypothetical protein